MCKIIKIFNMALIVFLCTALIHEGNFSALSDEYSYRPFHKLAAPTKIPDINFKKRVLARLAVLTNPGVNEFIRNQILEEKAISGSTRKWVDDRTDVVDIVNDRSLRGYITYDVDGFSSVVIVKIKGLFRHTGQFGHVGLSGEEYLNDLRELGELDDDGPGGIPVMYVDDYYYDKADKALIRHELDEILQWENLRVSHLGKTRKEMRDWIINSFEQADSLLDSEPGLKGKTSQALDEMFDEGAWPLEDLYKLVDAELDKLLDFASIRRLVEKYSGTESNINIAGKRKKKGKKSSGGGRNTRRGRQRRTGRRGTGRGQDAAPDKPAAKPSTMSDEEILAMFRYLSPEISAAVDTLLETIASYEGQRLHGAGVNQAAGAVFGARDHLNTLLVEKGYCTETVCVGDREGDFKTHVMYYRILKSRRYAIGGSEALVIYTKNIGEKKPVRDVPVGSGATFCNQQRILNIPIEDSKITADRIWGVMKGKGYKLKLDRFPSQLSRLVSDVQSLATLIIRQSYANKSYEEILTLSLEQQEFHEGKHLRDSVSGRIPLIAQRFGAQIPVIEESSASFTEIGWGPTPKMSLFFLMDNYIRNLMTGNRDQHSDACVMILKGLFPQINAQLQQRVIDISQAIKQYLEALRDIEVGELNRRAQLMHNQLLGCPIEQLPTMTLTNETEFEALEDAFVLPGAASRVHTAQSDLVTPSVRVQDTVEGEQDMFDRLRGLSVPIREALDELLVKVNTEGRKMPKADADPFVRNIIEARIHLNKLLIEEDYLVETHTDETEAGLRTVICAYRIYMRKSMQVQSSEFEVLHIKNMGKTHPGHNPVKMDLGSYDEEEAIIKIRIDSGANYFSFIDRAMSTGQYGFGMQNIPAGKAGFAEEAGNLCVSLLRNAYARIPPNQRVKQLIDRVEHHEIKHRIDDVSGLIDRVSAAIGFTERAMKLVVYETSAYLSEIAWGPTPKVSLYEVLSVYSSKFIIGRTDQYTLAFKNILQEIFPGIYARYKTGAIGEDGLILESLRAAQNISDDELRRLAAGGHRTMMGCVYSDLPAPQVLRIKTNLQKFGVLRGSPARFLETLLGNDELFEKARTASGFRMSEVIPLRKADDDVSESTIYLEREILEDLGVITKVDNYNKTINSCYRFSDSFIGAGSYHTARLIDLVNELEYDIGRKDKPLRMGDIPKDNNPVRSERAFVKELVSATIDGNNTMNLSDLIAPKIPGQPEKVSENKYYRVRYDEDKLKEYARQSGIDDESRYTPEALLKEYVDILKMRLGGNDRIEIKPFSGKRTRGQSLVSVTAYSSKDMTDSSKFGEGHVNMDFNLKGQTLRIIGMLNIAFAASNIPHETASRDLYKYESLISFIKRQYKEITGKDFDEVTSITDLQLIDLPPAAPVPLEKIEDYYRIAIKQLHSSA